MNIKDSLQALALARKLGVTLNFIAPHGEAKSSTMKQYAKANKMHYSEFRTGQAADAGDISGLPEFEMVQRRDSEGKVLVDEQTGQPLEYKVTNFVLPKWFPREENTLVFFDEWNRGAKDILNGIFETILDLSQKGQPMPKGCQVVAAMNPPTSDYGGTIDIDDKALMDRFVHIAFKPTKQEFMDYYRTKYGNSGFVEFLADDTEGKFLRGKTEHFDISSMVTPSPRSWETALKLEELYDRGEVEEGVFNEFLFGTIGTIATQRATDFKKTHIKSIKGKDLLEMYQNAPVRDSVLTAIKKGRTDMLGLALSEIDAEFKARKSLTDQEARNVIDLTKDLSKSAEHQYTLFRMIAQNQQCTGNCQGFELSANHSGTGLPYSKEILDLATKVDKVRREAEAQKEKSKKKEAVAEEV